MIDAPNWVESVALARAIVLVGASVVNAVDGHTNSFHKAIDPNGTIYSVPRLILFSCSLDGGKPRNDGGMNYGH
jgi:hypothetical protein